MGGDGDDGGARRRSGVAVLRVSPRRSGSGGSLLRKIDRFVDPGALRQELAPLYSPIGRPSIDPELLTRMLIVGYCFGIRSNFVFDAGSNTCDRGMGAAESGTRGACQCLRQ